MNQYRTARALAVIALGLTTASLWASGRADESGTKAGIVGT